MEARYRNTTAYRRQKPKRSLGMQAGIFRRCHLSQKERDPVLFFLPFACPLAHSLTFSHTRFIFLVSTPFSVLLRRPTRLGSSLSTCSTGPGGPRTGPRRSTGISCSHGRGSSDVRCPECAATTRPPPPRYRRFFSFLPFDPLTHFTGSARPLSSFFSISSASSYFKTREETGSLVEVVVGGGGGGDL